MKTTINLQHFSGDTEYVLTFPVSEMANAIALCGWTLANKIRAHGGSEALTELTRLEVGCEANDLDLPIPDGREWFAKFARKAAITIGKAAITIGTKVMYRGRFSRSYSLRGTVECFKDSALGDADYIGVRLENGNLSWVDEDQLKYMDGRHVSRKARHELEATHYLGRRLSGKLARFTSPLSDKEFYALTSEGLPPGWVAWHLEPGENIDNSQRVQELSRLPVVVEVCGSIAAMEIPGGRAPIVSAYPTAHPAKWLKLALAEIKETVSA